MALRRFSFAILSLGLASAALLPVSAVRAEPSAAEIAVARKLYKEASELENAKKWDQAEAKLRQAIAIKETPGLRYHLAFCLEQQGKLVDALVDYDRADEMIKAGNKAPDVAELVVSARESIKARIPTLTVKLPADASDAKVSIDGHAVSSAVMGQPLPQNPGRHRVQVTAPGREPYSQDVQLGESEKRELNVVLPPAKSEAAPPPAVANADDPPADSGTVSTDSSGWTARTWVLVGEGVLVAAGLGVGLFATFDKAGAQEEVDAAKAERDSRGVRSGDAACTNPEPEDVSACKQIPGLEDQVDSAATLQAVGFIGAGVGAAAALTTFLLWKPKTEAEAQRLPRLYATPTRGGGFIGLGGSF